MRGTLGDLSIWVCLKFWFETSGWNEVPHFYTHIWDIRDTVLKP